MRAAERFGPAAEDRAYLANYPLAALQLRKAEQLLVLWPRDWFTEMARQEVERFVAMGQAALDSLKAGRVAIGQQPGDLELAYISDTDGTAQPYYVHVPAKYDAEQPTPVVVFLHGYVPETSILDPWLPWEDVWAPAERLGWLFLTPYGRRNTDFLAVGEVDVLRSIEETARWFNVDRDRVYLFGVSMGGYGTWNIGLKYPHVFAAIGPISGQTDMVRWARIDRASLPAFRRRLFEWDNPLDLAENSTNIPIHVLHGATDDVIPKIESEAMVARLKALGKEVPYEAVTPEQAGWFGHYVYGGPYVYEKTIPWFEPHQRQRWPKRVVYKTYSLRYDTAYWLTIDQFMDWGKPALVEAQVEGNTVTVKADNAAGFTVRLDGELLDTALPVRVVANGQERFNGPVPETGAVQVFLDTEWEQQSGEGLWKRKGLCGPVEDAYNYPFLVVIGTTGEGQALTAQAAGNARRFLEDWDRYADGVPRWKNDSDVTEADIAAYDLVLFGRPQTNSVLSRIADGLPFKFERQAFVTPDGSRYEGDDVGLQMVYPNPLNPERYAVVWSGLYYGDRLLINHRHDLVPDFIIYDAGVGGQPGSFEELVFGLPNRHLYAGFFDRRWQPSPALTEKAR